MDENLYKNNLLCLNYIKNNSSAVTLLSENFLKGLGLTTFIYGRFFYDGTFIFYTNNIKWVENWFSNVHSIAGSSLHRFLQCVPDNGAPHYYLWESASPEDKIMFQHNHCGLWHGFDFHFRLEDSIEGWSFSTSKECAQINNYYLNNINIFHHFRLYFKEKAASLIEKNENVKLAILLDKVDLSFSPTCLDHKISSEVIAAIAFNSCSIHHNHKKIKLTKREVEGLYYLSQGKTIKEIGRILDISPRTVETHLINVKNKTECHNLSNLIDTQRDILLKWIKQ